MANEETVVQTTVIDPTPEIKTPADPQDITEARRAETDKKLLELGKNVKDDLDPEKPEDEKDEEEVEAKTDEEKKDEEKKPQTDKEKRIDLEKWQQKNRLEEKRLAAKADEIAKIQNENNQLQGWVQDLVQLRDSGKYDEFLEKLGLPLDKLIKAKYEETMADPKDRKYRETETAAQKALKEVEDIRAQLKSEREENNLIKERNKLETSISAIDIKAKYPLTYKAGTVYGKDALNETIFEWVKEGHELEEVLEGLEKKYTELKGTPHELKWMSEIEEEKPESLTLTNMEPAGKATKNIPTTITSGGAGGKKQFTSVEERKAAIDAKINRLRI